MHSNCGLFLTDTPPLRKLPDMTTRESLLHHIADAICALADALAADPGVGLAQSAPRLINTPTLFGRLQRFATLIMSLRKNVFGENSAIDFRYGNTGFNSLSDEKR